jgi:hypothetical protein
MGKEEREKERKVRQQLSANDATTPTLAIIVTNAFPAASPPVVPHALRIWRAMVRDTIPHKHTCPRRRLKDLVNSLYLESRAFLICSSTDNPSDSFTFLGRHPSTRVIG